MKCRALCNKRAQEEEAQEEGNNGWGKRWETARHDAADGMPGSPRRRGRPPGSHPGGPAATKRVSFSDPLVSTPSPPAPPQDGPRTIFLPGEEVFACPGPVAPSRMPQTRYPSRQRAPPKRLDL
jgi:hypothetical protein